ncbi:hypothetical protein PsYK624_139320 [Phanerochaete sordida]|uniref:F-box domain-containing protein n=1 Tax=Phanerochaete sordida TaxID=48140 RepID=A0A9P3GMZ0_9APHY|nr:hypothetical protein PsYK624_139320 [Phanerochaete sordida]
MTETLPDEILDEILAYNLTLSHTDFLAFHDGLRYWSRSESPRCSDLVLVSKRWLRVGTPLLYECVRLAKPAHTAAVAQLLRAQPQVGRSVRCLRLEGGLGRDLVHIARAATRLESLYVEMRVKSADSITGLVKALPLLQPRHLYLENDFGRRDNKKIAEVRKAMEAYVRDAALPLKSVTLSDWFQGMNRTWASAIAASSVEELSCRSSDMVGWIRNGLVRAMLQNSRLQRVVCRGTFEEASIRKCLQRQGFTKADMEKFSFVRHSMDRELEILALEFSEWGTSDNEED